VRALPEPRPRFVWTLPRIDLRRTLLVAAPAVLALGVGAAALHGVLAGGTKPTALTARPPALAGGVQHGAGAAVIGSRNVPTFSAHANDQSFNQALNLAPGALPPATTRLNKYNAWLRVRVAD